MAETFLSVLSSNILHDEMEGIWYRDISTEGPTIVQVGQTELLVRQYLMVAIPLSIEKESAFVGLWLCLYCSRKKKNLFLSLENIGHCAQEFTSNTDSNSLLTFMHCLTNREMHWNKVLALYALYALDRPWLAFILWLHNTCIGCPEILLSRTSVSKGWVVVTLEYPHQHVVGNNRHVAHPLLTLMHFIWPCSKWPWNQF